MISTIANVYRHVYRSKPFGIGLYANLEPHFLMGGGTCPVGIRKDFLHVFLSPSLEPKEISEDTEYDWMGWAGLTVFKKPNQIRLYLGKILLGKLYRPIAGLSLDSVLRQIRLPVQLHFEELKSGRSVLVLSMALGKERIKAPFPYRRGPGL